MPRMPALRLPRITSKLMDYFDYVNSSENSRAPRSKSCTLQVVCGSKRVALVRYHIQVAQQTTSF